MAKPKAFCAAGFGHPPRADVTSAIACGIEAKTADGHEDMPVPYENGDIFTGAAFAVLEESLARHGAVHEAGGAQDVGC